VTIPGYGPGQDSTSMESTNSSSIITNNSTSSSADDNDDKTSTSKDTQDESQRNTLPYSWSSELATVGETQGDTTNYNSRQNAELKFTCQCTNSTNDDLNDGVIHEQNAPVSESIVIKNVYFVGKNNEDLVGVRIDIMIVVKSPTTKKAATYSKEKKISCQLKIRSTLNVTNYRPIIDQRQTSTNLSQEDDLILQSIGMGLTGNSPSSKSGAEHVYTTSLSHLTEISTYTQPPPSQQPLKLNALIVPALNIDILEVSGAASPTGITLVSLVIRHSNYHNENVIVNNIALHPGHSRLWVRPGIQDNDNNEKETLQELKAMPGGEGSVINMSRCVRWGYVSGTAPSLPFTLQPHEAVATVIQINASENMMARRFVCPICVHALVDTHSTLSLCSSDSKSQEQELVQSSSNNDDDDDGKDKTVIMASTDATWTTTRMAIGLTNAFRVDISTQDSQCTVGAMIIVSLKILNLSSEDRDLMLLMAKDTAKRSDVQDNILSNGEEREDDRKPFEVQTVNARVSPFLHQSKSVHTAVVSEVNGYTFGVWGLGDDDGTVRHSRDRELLALDAALLLGEVKGQYSMEAELRFVALREGALDVPNFKLYDRFNGHWYDCVHSLKIVSTAKQQ